MLIRSTARMLMLLGSLVMFAACGGGDESDVPQDLGDCPPDSMADQLAGQMVIARSCLSCHSEASTNRMNAPVGVDMDNATYVMTNAEFIYDKILGTAASSPSRMPPGAPLNDEQTKAVHVYLSCQ